MKKPTALVLGAGIGGLSAAGQLANNGYQVTILEKNATPGGKIIRFRKGGFTFDGGPSFITLTEVYRDWFASQGVQLENYIKLRKMKETTTFHFANGKKLTLSTDPAKVREEIRTRFPGDEEGFDRFMEMGGKIYELLYRGPRFARRNYHKLFGFDYIFHPKVFSFLSTLHVHESWKNIVDRMFKHEELRAVFSYQATFLGMRPSEALGTYCFFPWAEIHDGMYQVEGGIYAIVEGFVKRCAELGVQFVYNAEVERLEYANSRLTAVHTAQGAYTADVFVSNIDGAYFYDRLMPPEKNRTFPKGSLERMKHTNSYFTINLGLKKPVPGCTHHTFYVARDWEDFTENILKPGSVPKFTPENTCYYFLQPSLLEPGSAPAGKATAFILIPVPGYDPGFDWNTYEATFKNFIYDLMEQRDGIPIRSLIEEEVIYSPARWGKEFNLWQNVILSFSLNFLQANGFRMPNRSREFENLYFTGSSTIPGPGIPPCISSGELVVERILEDAGMKG
ncbi:MAG: phytoene desaturase family protein [Patescibacteria group bacterium]|nr:phytoene desaturase family protein [Patescibacteria group bacterium]